MKQKREMLSCTGRRWRGDSARESHAPPQLAYCTRTTVLYEMGDLPCLASPRGAGWSYLPSQALVVMLNVIGRGKCFALSSCSLPSCALRCYWGRERVLGLRAKVVVVLRPREYKNNLTVCSGCWCTLATWLWLLHEKERPIGHLRNRFLRSDQQTRSWDKKVAQQN